MSVSLFVYIEIFFFLKLVKLTCIIVQLAHCAEKHWLVCMSVCASAINDDAMP